jgi:glycosyltransferase involved in cell wall biosynthesis
MNPLVSIIIPTYNRAHLISKTLESVLAQTYPNWECIIVDDGSTDYTPVVLEDYLNDKRFKFYKRTNNRKKGPSSCRNIGIENTKGILIMFLDSDDLITAVCLENRMKFAIDNEGFDFWIFNSDQIDIVNNKRKKFNKQLNTFEDEEYLNFFLLEKIPFCVSGALWKKEALEQIDGFDENLLLLEDPDLHLRGFASNLKSKTCINGLSDHFYMFNSEKESFSQNTLLSYLYFSNKHKKQFGNRIKPYIISGMRKALKSNKLSYSLEFYFLLIQTKSINWNQFFIIPILFCYQLVHAQKKQRSGFTTLMKLTSDTK